MKWCFLKSDFNQLNSFPGAMAGKIVEAAGDPDIGAAPRLAFVSDKLVQDAREAKAGLALADEQQGQGLQSLLALARIELLRTTTSKRHQVLLGALAINPDDGALWTETARAANAITGNADIAGQAAIAALNGYQLSRTTQDRADALSVLAKSLENSENYRAALSAYKASLALVEAKTVRAAYADLRARQGFRVIDHTIDADSVTPRACVQFSEQLLKGGTDYTPFVTLDGAAPPALRPRATRSASRA